MRLDNQNYTRFFHKTKATITLEGNIIIQTPTDLILGKIMTNKTYTTTIPVTRTIHKWITSKMDTKRLSHLFK